jgi:hypothetical protein
MTEYVFIAAPVWFTDFRVPACEELLLAVQFWLTRMNFVALLFDILKRQSIVNSSVPYVIQSA